MTRNEFTKKVSHDTGKPFSHAKPWVDDIFNCLADALLTEDEIKFPGFGTFKQVVRKGHFGRHAVTGEIIRIPDRYVIKFVPASAISDELKQIPIVSEDE